MKRFAAVLVGTLLVAGCAPAPAELVVAGRVKDRLETVAVPTLAMPAVNLDAGFESSGQRTADASRTASTYALGSFIQLADVLVAEGDTVRVGQTLATLDASGLEAQVQVAKADAKVTAAQVDLLAAAIDKTDDKAEEVADKTADVKKAINTLTDTKAKLVKARKQLKKQRPLVAKQLKQAQELLANYPPVPVPGIPSREELQQGIAKLKAALKKMDAGLKKINTNLPKLEKGLRKAKDGLEKLADAADKITDARAGLVDLKELAEIAADTMQVPIELAQVQFKLAVLTAPADGVVVSVAASGDRLAPGATAVAIRPATPSKVTAWLSPVQLGQVCVGDEASVAGDWGNAATPATLTRIAPAAEYPPTSVPTEEVHLTRAVEVEFTATAQLPAGVPVEITINGCRFAADHEEGR
ncbi:MAG TPA: HlyD family efflux transporter periplasmic adaptor subunit [Propionicimonas sp.]|nr:HlyD family efflux transporter periplasmic adaptor subunit [Propionicimonas sp.]